MELEAYRPKSCLRVPEHFIERPRFPVIDAHTHFGALVMGEDYPSLYDTGETLARLAECGIEKVVNLDLSWGEGRYKMLKKTEGFEDKIIQFGTVPVEKFAEPGFDTLVYRSIEDGVRLGMRGLKLWKPIGLGLQDKDGTYLRPDDERLQAVYQTAAEFHIPILFHIADPIAFFDPVDEYNERYEELGGNPDWSFSDPKFYRFDELMQMQENMIAKNPKTTFIIAHVGSCSEDLSRVAGWLDKYPNMNIDIAARISELGRQPYTAKAFLEKYSDRILFGTDFCAADMPIHRTYFRFLETYDEYFNPQGSDDWEDIQGRWNIYGVGLSDETLQKIYSGNVKRLLGI